MTKRSRTFARALMLTTAVSLYSLNAVAAEPEKDAVSPDKVEKLVQDTQHVGEKDTAAVGGDGKTGEVGEASYNIENCEALIKDAQENGSSKAGAESHDLDKCHQLVK